MPEAGMRPLPWCPFHACAVLVSLAVPVSVDGSHDCCHGVSPYGCGDGGKMDVLLPSCHFFRELSSVLAALIFPLQR